MDRNRHGVQGFEFADQGTEVGKTASTIGFEFFFLMNRLDDLTDDLRQPSQRMGFYKA
jgi:hypothetical protein